jgi:beta-lactamase regulating signal transducer with metallopeptidase domain
METISLYVTAFALDALWQVSAVTLLAWACDRLMRNAPARHRHCLWFLALLTCLLLPCLSLTPFLGIQNLLRSGAALLPAHPGGAGGGLAVVSYDGLFRLKGFTDGGSRPFITSVLPRLTITSLYLCSLLHALAMFLRGWRRAGAIRLAASVRNLPAPVASVARRCQSAFHLRAIPILTSARAAGPLTAGVFRPLIIIPEGLLTQGSEDTLTSAIGHELAHVKRRDFALNVIGELLSLPVAFHPALRLIKRRLVSTREIACDEMVTERLIDSARYARALLTLADSFVGASHTLAASDAGTLEDRVMNLINGRRLLSERKGRALLIATLIIFTCLTCLATAVSPRVGARQGQTTEAVASIVGEWVLLTGDDKSSGQDSDSDMSIRVVFSLEGDRLKGTALVPKVVNGDAAGTSRLPLIDPAFDGQLLSFKIKDQGVLVAELKLSDGGFVGQYRIENSDEKGPLKLTRKK